jgi:hypothetical protein
VASKANGFQLELASHRFLLEASLSEVQPLKQQLKKHVLRKDFLV